MQELDRTEEALEEYRRAAELDPGNTGAHNNAGIALAELGRDAEAVACFDRAINLDPANFDLHCNKALSLQGLGLHGQALAHFDRAAELSPGSADAYDGRLSCLSELGLPDKPIGRYARESLGPAAPAPREAVPGAPGRPEAALAAEPGDGREQLVRSLLSKDESDVLEFKSWLGMRREDAQKQGRVNEKIARALCCMVNTRGGDLLIGVGDDGSVEGLAPGGARLSRKERDKMLTRMANVIVEYFGAEHDGHFDREIVGVDRFDILHCAVTASKNGPVLLKKRLEGKHDFFVRAGSTCRPLGTKEALEYVKTKWPERAADRQATGRSEINEGGELAGDVQGVDIGFPVG